MTRRSLQGTGSWQPPSRPRRFRSLASRLVALGVVQLFLLALTAIIVFIAEGPHDEANPEDKITAETVAGLERLVDYPAALNDALDALRTERVEISLYDEAHQLIASNVDPPLAIPQRPPRRFRRPPGDDHWPPPDNHGPPPDDDHRPPPSDDHQPWPSPNDDRRSPDDDRRPPPDDHHRPPSDDEHRPPLDDDHREPADRPSADQPAAHAEGRPSADRPTDRAEDRPSADRPASRADDRPPGPPESWGPPGGRGFPGRHRLILPFHPHGTHGVLVARGVHGDPPGLTGPLLVLFGGFAILVIGALISARWIVRPIERLSRTARALGSGDLQARSRLDRADEIGELGHRFDEMADRIAGLLLTEKELLANVAHELRTPLTRIGVALDLANEGDGEAARASLAEIAVDVSELETIVDDILTAMRFEIVPGKAPAQLPLRRAVVPAAEIAAAAADRLRARHPDRPLEVVAAADLPAIYVDPVLFRRVIDNLLENAHKYTAVPDSQIELHVFQDGSDAVFEVRDRGIGISSEDLPRIFTAFFRSERSRSRETGGVGLGLTLAKRIVEAHGGTIDATSAVNLGTTIRVTIPAAPGARALAQESLP